MTPNDRSPRALVLTANRDALQSLTTAFERRGFAVVAASDGANGVAALLDHLLTLDVLVSDLDLPGRDGASLLRLVRLAGGERELAIVIRCEAASPRDRVALRALGADAVVAAADGADRIAALADEAVSARALGETAPPVPAPGGRVPPRLRSPHRVEASLGASPLALPA